jgi:hypothetical protein
MGCISTLSTLSRGSSLLWQSWSARYLPPVVRRNLHLFLFHGMNIRNNALIRNSVHAETVPIFGQGKHPTIAVNHSSALCTQSVKSKGRGMGRSGVTLTSALCRRSVGIIESYSTAWSSPCRMLRPGIYERPHSISL